jgi:hypothetical protein
LKRIKANLPRLIHIEWNDITTDPSEQERSDATGNNQTFSPVLESADSQTNIQDEMEQT